MKLDITKVRNLLQEFDFKAIFIEELGWSQPPQGKATPFVSDGSEYEVRQIARLSGDLFLSKLGTMVVDIREHI